MDRCQWFMGMCKPCLSAHIFFPGQEKATCFTSLTALIGCVHPKGQVQWQEPPSGSEKRAVIDEPYLPQV